MDQMDSNDQIMKPISIDPDEVSFNDVVQGKTYTKTIKITNNLKFLVPFKIKCSCKEKIDIKPREIRISPQKSQNIEITLKMGKPFALKAGVKVPIKEFIFIKSENFDHKIKLFINPDNCLPLPIKYLTTSSCENEEDNKIDEFETLLEGTPKEVHDHSEDSKNCD